MKQVITARRVTAGSLAAALAAVGVAGWLATSAPSATVPAPAGFHGQMVPRTHPDGPSTRIVLASKHFNAAAPDSKKWT